MIHENKHIPTEHNSAYWYLASPYGKHPAGHEEANRRVCKAAAQLLKAGLVVFSPIAHSHAVATIGGVEQTSHDFWLWADGPMMWNAVGAIVLMDEGWQQSYGVGVEIAYFSKARKPIIYAPPEVIAFRPNSIIEECRFNIFYNSDINKGN